MIPIIVTIIALCVNCILRGINPFTAFYFLKSMYKEDLFKREEDGSVFTAFSLRCHPALRAWIPRLIFQRIVLYKLEKHLKETKNQKFISTLNYDLLTLVDFGLSKKRVQETFMRLLKKKSFFNNLVEAIQGFDRPRRTDVLNKLTSFLETKLFYKEDLLFLFHETQTKVIEMGIMKKQLGLLSPENSVDDDVLTLQMYKRLHKARQISCA